MLLFTVSRLERHWRSTPRTGFLPAKQGRGESERLDIFHSVLNHTEAQELTVNSIKLLLVRPKRKADGGLSNTCVFIYLACKYLFDSATHIKYHWLVPFSTLYRLLSTLYCCGVITRIVYTKKQTTYRHPTNPIRLHCINF